VLLAALAYGLLVVVAPQRLGFDEWFYLQTALTLPRLGLSPEFVANLPGPTGILHSLVHAAAAPFTAYALPGIRWVNVVLLAASFALLLAALRAERCLPVQSPGSRHPSESPLALAALWLAAPTTGTIACLALTEMAAIVLALVSTLLLLLAARPASRVSASQAALLVGAGLALGAASWGRQNLIVLVAAALPFFLPLRGRQLGRALLFALPALLLFAWPISVWQGLVPPGWVDAGPGIRPTSFLVSLAYLGLIALLLLPGLLHLSRRRLAAALLLAVPLVLASADLRIVPSRALVSSVAGPVVTGAVGVVLGIALVALALLTLLALLERLRAAIPQNPLAAYGASAVLLICLSNIKIVHQFSSRYIALVLPFLILAAAFPPPGSPSPPGGWAYGWRFLAGLGLSVLLVLNYYRVIGW
jgi:hypothetical protein